MQALIAAAIVLAAVLIGGAIGTLKFHYDRRILKPAKPKKAKSKPPDVGDLGFLVNVTPADSYWQDALIKIVDVIWECSGTFFRVQKYYSWEDRALYNPHRPSMWLNPSNFELVSRYSDEHPRSRKDHS